MIGTQIGSYQVVEKLGEGGMGVVYKGIDTTLDRPVAIKVLSQELVGTPALVERFRSEAKAQATLNHTNIATLYSFLQIGGNCVIIMELLDGETFDQIIRRRGLIPAEEAVPLFRQALLGIGFAHRMGIVHRDIKPSNIMVTKSGIVKVMDFGIAKVLGGQRMTKTGTRMGTVAYMSPEQIRNMPVDIRSDIYSLGVTLYEMMTAHLPFESESDFQVMSDHVNTPAPPPTKYYPYIAPGFEQCVMKALAKNPDDRFQTVEEFGAGLEHPLGLPGYVPAVVAQGGWNQQPAIPIPAAPWAPAGGTPPPSNPGAWTPTGAAQGGQWTPPGTPPPGGRNWTPPPRTPAGGTYPGAPGGGQQSMGGATWIGDGPAGSGPPYGGGMSGATQVSMPSSGGATPSTGASAGPSKNMIFIVAGAAALLLILVAVGIAHWRNSDDTGGGGGGSVVQYTGGGGSSGGGSSSTGSGGGGGGTSTTPAPQPVAGGGGLIGGSGSGSGNGGGGLLPPTPTTGGGGGGNHASPPPRNVAPAPAPAPSVAPPQPSPAPSEPAAKPTPAPGPGPSAPTGPGSHRYFVQHRHVSINFKSKTGTSSSYCEGYLTVNADGTGSYYCTQTFDGRCDRVTFSAGSIKEVKVNGTQLHLASSFGNYDFYGTAADMEAAFQTLSQTIKH